MSNILVAMVIQVVITGNDANNNDATKWNIKVFMSSLTNNEEVTVIVLVAVTSLFLPAVRLFIFDNPKYIIHFLISAVES